MAAVHESLFDYDRSAAALCGGLLAGVDESGCGPLAGPVVAAAVILYRGARFTHLNDCKQVTPLRRECLYQEIIRSALVAVGTADEKEIDTLNIFQATRLAMTRAVLSLPRTPELLLIDGRIRLDLPIPQKAIIKGDEKSASIAAASIVAKVYRDAWMRHLDLLYPRYHFKKHKGYATAFHLKILKSAGPSPVHRASFSPCMIPKEETPHEA